MNYKEFKALKDSESKAFKGVNGVWTLAAYLISYRTKELLLVLVAALFFWLIIVIVNPSVAATIRHFMIKVGWLAW